MNPVTTVRLYQFADSAKAIDQNIAINDIQTKYQTREKELENEVWKNKDKKNKALLYIFIGLLLASLIIGFLIIKNARKKEKISRQEKLIEQQKLEKALKDYELNSIDMMLEGQEKERQRIEPEMQQGKIHPAFLVNTLNKIELLAVEKPAIIPVVIGKIKNLLLYAVYENGASRVSLEKEMKLLEEFVEIERAGRDLTYINFKMIGDPRNKKIAPFIALPLVENSFRQLSSFNVQQKYIDLNILVEHNQFNLDIAWSKPIDTSTLTNGGSALLQNIGKRLNLLYPQSHSLKVTIEPERFQVKMAINLSGAIVV